MASPFTHDPFLTGGQLLILGFGNSLRRDDGAGLVLAEALAAAWQRAGRRLRVVTAHQLGPEHALEIVAPAVAAVLFIDAAVGVSTPQLTPVAAHADDAPAGGHHMSVSTILLYALFLDARTRPAWLLTIPAYDLAHGEGLSPATQAHLDHLLADAETLWRQLRTGQR